MVMVTGTSLAGAYGAIRETRDRPELAALVNNLDAIRASAGKLAEAMALVRDRLAVPPSNSLAGAVAAVRKGTDWPPPIIKENLGHAAKAAGVFVAQQAGLRERLGVFARELGRVRLIPATAMRPMLEWPEGGQPCP